jgi:hypothetical protein
VTGDYYGQMPDPPFDANDAKPNRLYLNDGHGRFTDATDAWGLGETSRWSLSSLFADYDGDGRPDLLVTNDFGLKNLYRNDGGHRFVDEAGKAGAEVRAYGMSAAWADFDGDGLFDLYTTGTDAQWYFLHDYPSLPIGFPGRVFLPIAILWMETMSTGNSLLLQKPDHTFTDADGNGSRLGRTITAPSRPTSTATPARHLRHQRRGATGAMRPRARVLVAVPRLLGRLRRRHQDLRPQGAGIAGVNATAISEPLRRPRPLPATTSSKSVPSWTA